MRRSSSGALEHCVQEHGMFGNVLMENCQTVADLKTPRSMVEQQMGGEVPLLLFLCTPSLAARRCMESYVCRKTWVYGLWPFFFQMGSLSNNMCLIQIWNHLGEDLPANQQRCLGGQCCPWGWSEWHQHTQSRLVALFLVWSLLLLWIQCDVLSDWNGHGSYQPSRCRNLDSKSWFVSPRGFITCLENQHSLGCALLVLLSGLQAVFVS